MRQRHAGVPAAPPRGVSPGPQLLEFTPPFGASLSAEDAAPYVGRYVMPGAAQREDEMLIARVQDGEDHWSLSLARGNVDAFTLAPVAPDSFVAQFSSAFRVAFVREEGAVTAIEISWLGSVRRAVKAFHTWQ